MNHAPGKINTTRNCDLIELAEAEDEFYCFEKRGWDHDDLDEEIEKNAKEWDCQKNDPVLL